MTVYNILKAFCAENRIPAEDNQLLLFERLTDLLLTFNRHTNVTAIKDRQSIAVKHYADSLTPLIFGLLPQNARVIDIGCGAGFPGLPLKILRDDLSVSFLDSTEKKLLFPMSVARQFGFAADFIPGRAEEQAFGSLREHFDVALSRAVAPLRVLLELCLPYVKPGGILIAYKSVRAASLTDPDSELAPSKNALGRLRGEVLCVKRAALPRIKGEMPRKHALIVVQKREILSTDYPRRYAQILKNPL